MVARACITLLHARSELGGDVRDIFLRDVRVCRQRKQTLRKRLRARERSLDGGELLR